LKTESQQFSSILPSVTELKSVRAVVEQKRSELEEQEKKKEETAKELAETNNARKRAKQELKEVKNEVIAKRERMVSVQPLKLDFIS